MKLSKMTWLLAAVMLLVLLSTPAWAQDEEEEEQPTAKDTPYFSGMPNYKIIDAYDREFADYNFFNGKDCTTMEGKKSHRAYTLKEEAEPASELQISRNYANAVKNMGGTIIFEGICESADCAENCGYRMMVGKVLKGDNELWVEIVPFNDGGDYYITLIAKESMKQDVTAATMFEALNKDGRVALYINFDFGKATIRADSRPIIDQIVQMMKANPDLKLSVEGHTDNVGDPQSNKSLSESRARAVASEIVAQGIDAGRLTSVGHGEDMPVADNNTEEGRAKNRRVELVKKEKTSSGTGAVDPSQDKMLFGVEVYPGAKLDEEQTKFASDIPHQKTSYYITNDNVQEVLAFYREQKGLICTEEYASGAVFALGDEASCTVWVTIANPWNDLKTGESHLGTMIMIYKIE